jgi:hypothetical protein
VERRERREFSSGGRSRPRSCRDALVATKAWWLGDRPTRSPSERSLGEPGSATLRAAARSETPSRPRKARCERRPAYLSGKAVALRRCTRRSPERLAGVVEVARREREDRKTYRVIDQYVASRLRRFLVRRHKVRTHGTRQFPNVRLYREYGLHSLEGV